MSAAWMLQHVPAVVYALDVRTYTLTYLNHAALALLGLSVEQAAAKPELAWDVVHPDDQAYARAHLLDPSLWQQGTVSFVQRIRDGHGAWRKMAHREQILHRDAAGQPTHIVGLAQDVTAIYEVADPIADPALLEGSTQQDAPSELADVQRTFDVILRSAPIVLWAMDAESTCTLSEGLGLAAFNLRPKEMVGANLLQRYHGQPLQADIAFALSGHEHMSTMQTAAGAWNENYYWPIIDAQGALIRVVGLTLDVSARKQTEVLHVNAARLQRMVQAQQQIATAPLDARRLMEVATAQLIAHTPYQSAVIAALRDGVLVVEVAAGAGLELLGTQLVPEKVFLGACVVTQKPVASKDILLEPHADLALAHRLGLRSVAAVPLYCNNQLFGAILASSSAPGIDEPAHIKIMEVLANFLGTALSHALEFSARQDMIAALRRSQQQLIEARNTAQAAMLAKNEFLASMSHEIRTPLNGIIGAVDLLADTHLTDLQRRYLRIMRSSGNGLLAVINDIIRFSDVGASALCVENVPFDLAQVIEDKTALLQAQAQDKGLALTIQVDAALALLVHGDPVRLGQVILNLLSNAIKFTDQGSVTLTVDGACVGDVTYTRFRVADTGVGVSLSNQQRIFKPFSQADPTTNRKYGGTGLGLSISKQLVETMGGSMGLESTVGVGSTFWFLLPLAAAPAVATLVADAPQSFQGNAKSSSTAVMGHVLVVDDNPVNQLVAVSMLKNLGFSSDVVANGREAVEAVLHKQYAMVLMDCQMPDMDGYEATRRIRAQEATHHDAHLPIIALTASVLREEQDHCLRVGMDDWLAKPIKKDTLGDALAKWMRPREI